MILSEEVGLQVDQVERLAARKLDPPQERSLVVEDVDGARAEFAAVAGARDYRAEFQIMLATEKPGSLHRFERERLHPLRAAGLTVLPTEIVSGVRGGSQIHVG